MCIRDRDIVNLLFWSGAKGVEVGGKRIIAQSSIRCAGPVLLVNHLPVAVNPVVIRAVGDSDVPVSYTHLAVLTLLVAALFGVTKLELACLTLTIAIVLVCELTNTALEILCDIVCADVEPRIRTVSYTHLDVYKRQAYQWRKIRVTGSLEPASIKMELFGLRPQR